MGVRHNNVIPNQHFKKKWQFYVKTWFNQPARKKRRSDARKAKAQAVFPRPVAGALRPVVSGQTVRYNMKKRAGRGFTLEELKEAKVNRKEARTIGISVDFRRKNRSEQSLRENVARLSEYKANLIVFPKKCNRKKPQATDSSKDACSKAEQVIGDVMPIVKPKPTIVPYKITQADKDKKVFYTLRVCQSDAKLVGKREAARKKAEADAAEKKKASV